VKFLLEHWYLVFAAAVSGGMLLWPVLRGASAGGGIGTTEAVRLINREKGVLIDVGEPAEFAALHAGGARNVPLGTLGDAKGLPGNKTLPLLVMCPTGTRAARAAAQLRKLGYEKAVAVTGGTAAWRDASLPLEKNA